MIATTNKRSLSALLLLALVGAGLGAWALGSRSEARAPGVGVVSRFGGKHESARVVVRPLASSPAALSFSLARGDALPATETDVASNGAFEFESSEQPLALSALASSVAAGISTALPLQAASVHLEPAERGFRVNFRPQSAEGTALSEGRFEAYSPVGHLLADVPFTPEGVLAFLPPGQAFVRFSSPGHAPVVRKLLVLADDARDWILPRARPLEVSVTHDRSNDAPIQVALIGALGQLVDIRPLGAGGVVRFPHVGPGEHRVWAGSFEREVARELSVDEARKDALSVSLDLSGGRESEHAVALPHQESASGCTPRVTSSFRGPEGRVGEREVEASVGSKGRLALILPPVETEVVVRCGDQTTQARFFGEEPRGLSGFLSTRVLTGRVQAPDSASLSGAEVGFVLEGFRSPLAGGVVAADGTYRLRVPLNARGRLFVSHPLLGKASLDTTISADQAGIGLELLPEYFVEGRLADEDGRPVSHATVAYTSMTGGSGSAPTDERGFFRVGPVGADRGYLVAFAEGRRLSDRPLAVTPGEESSAIDWKLGRAVGD